MASYVKKSKLVFNRGIVEATLTLDIRVQDMDLIKKYGPARVNFGGDVEYTLDYQTAVDNNLYTTVDLGDPEPATVDLIFKASDNYHYILDDLKVTKRFSLPTVEIGSIVAEKWYADKILLIQEEINRIRGIDPGLVHDRTLIEI